MGNARRRKLAQSLNVTSLAMNTDTAPVAWPLSSAKEQARLEKLFTHLGIDFSLPGFQDSPAFLAEERARPEILDDYARYVEVRAYSDAELLDAKRKIQVAAEVVNAAVMADGRRGLCVVASGVLSRILDELRVWNFSAKATMTVTVSEGLVTRSQYFYALDKGSFSAPHAVVVAPPFLVIDTTAAAQAYPHGSFNACIPPLIMQEQFKPYRWTDEDIVAPVVRSLYRPHSSLQQYLAARNPSMLKRLQDFPARVADFAQGSAAYVITGVGGYVEKLSDLPLEHTQLAGKSAISLFADEVLPRLGMQINAA